MKKVKKSSTQLKVSSVEKLAIKMRNCLEHDGSIEFDDLKGKFVEFIDLDFKTRIHRCIKVRGNSVVTVSAVHGGKRFVKKKNGEIKETRIVSRHVVRQELIIGAYARRNNSTRLEVV